MVIEKTNSAMLWFGDAFSLLHPQLQTLHLQGGDLIGSVDLVFGSGLAGIIGKRSAKNLGMPMQPGAHALRVTIRHLENGLHWSRCFNERQTVLSIFKPFGCYPDGYWLEKTGAISLKLGVDIVDSGWHWRLRSVNFYGLPLPLFMFPHSVAYKKIIDGNYQFHVDFSIPLIGQLFSYEGTLVPKPA